MMSTISNRVKKIHVNFMCVSSICELVHEPSKINPKLSFFSDWNEYVGQYKDLFYYFYNLRKGANANPRPNIPFIRGLGMLTPLSGREIKNTPRYKKLGGNFSTIIKNMNYHLEKWLLPMKLEPNWNINLEPGLLSENEFFNCHPLIKIYPLGVVLFEIRFSFKSKNGIEIKRCIELIDAVRSRRVLISTDNKKYSVMSLIKKFQRIILTNFLGCAEIQNLQFSPINRIMSLSGVSNGFDPIQDTRELAGLISLNKKYEKLSNKAIENKIGSMFSGEYIDQFIRVQPSSSVIYAPYPSDDLKYNSYVEKCMRRNYTSIVEAVTVQNQFTKSTIGILKNLLNMKIEVEGDLISLDSKLNRIEGFDWLFSDDLKHHFMGHDVKIYNHFYTIYGIESNINQCRYLINKIEEGLKERENISISETMKIKEIIRHLDEMYRICYSFSTENPLGLSVEVDIAKTIMDEAEEKRDDLMAWLDDLKAIEDDPYSTRRDKSKLNRAIKSLILSDYRTEIIPEYEKFVNQVLEKEDEIVQVAEKKRKEGVEVPDSSEIKKKVETAKEQIGDDASSTLKKAYVDLTSFATSVEPYVETLLSVSKTVLILLGISI